MTTTRCQDFRHGEEVEPESERKILRSLVLEFLVIEFWLRLLKQVVWLDSAQESRVVAKNEVLAEGEVVEGMAKEVVGVGR